MLITVGDDISTGDMAPDGAIAMSIWSNIAECARFMFRRIDPPSASSLCCSRTRHTPYAVSRLWCPIWSTGCAMPPIPSPPGSVHVQFPSASI
ncbi:hypothetical protein H7X46_04465 [Pseudonocardia sp. C8]|uniref:hypothetical protein n=1 Tax=Pseudonocardia sp. C8 TaxID=2762759 RepID=UPI001642B3A7|nr:hypothetical protein [Pseudonocardia sp. C8]MBC3190311.1 hypothetical protein [Pseudonocardia sp. C8]